MNSLFLVIFSFIGYILAYHLYGKYLSQKIFSLNNTILTPAHTLTDGRDYVPSKKEIVFGHHFTSIAGLGPIVGPAIAIIWGWVPALLWVFLGSIFIGAVHDLTALVVSMRNSGKSIGEAAGSIVNPRVKTLFLFIIFFALWIVISVFALIIAILFTQYPSSVFPIWMQIPIAVWLGYVITKKGKGLLKASSAALVLVYLMIYGGTIFPLTMPSLFGLTPEIIWIIILLIYVFIASTVPVWTLLQPRDFLNSLQLIVMLLLLIGGIFVARAPVVAPAYNPTPEGAPPLIPFLFIIVACGAVSGFHSLVSSGTSSKQIRQEGDALFIGYGSMLLEGILSTLVIIAVSAGIGLGFTVHSEGVRVTGIEAWNAHYISWHAASGLSAKIGAFVTGSANLMSSLGISESLSVTIMGVFLVSFASTTLDSSVRLQRYVLTELAEAYRIKFFQGRYQATAFAVITAFILALSQPGGKGALVLWPLFGSVNQLLAGLALMVGTVYLIKKEKPCMITALPMMFILFMNGWTMLLNLHTFFLEHQWLIFTIGLIVLVLEVWMIIESFLVLKRIAPDDLLYRKASG
jgi:carbon starvation protein